MNDNIGTLEGLIAELEELHKRKKEGYSKEYTLPGDVLVSGADSCNHCSNLGYDVDTEWPCPTMEIVHKHKQGQWTLEEYPGSSNPKVTHYVADQNRVGQIRFEGTEAECEAWIKEQI